MERTMGWEMLFFLGMGIVCGLILRKSFSDWLSLYKWLRRGEKPASIPDAEYIGRPPSAPPVYRRTPLPPPSAPWLCKKVKDDIMAALDAADKKK